jgi:hypothetical protein
MIKRLIRRLPMGTRSVLCGAHCFFLHPLFVAAAWTKLYGFPWDPRLWVAFFVHDLGYWGLGDMEGEAGEEHVRFGAQLMRRLFGEGWGMFTLTGLPVSKLCIADKAAFLATPRWLYLPMVRLTGELQEYLESSLVRHPTNKIHDAAKLAIEYPEGNVWREHYETMWHIALWEYICVYVGRHRGGGVDTMTPNIAAWTKGGLTPEEENA